MIFVDTNYFLRFLLIDNTKQRLEAENLFLEAAKGRVKLITSMIVFFEIYWVFKSYYNKNKPELIDILQKLMKMDFIQIENKEILYICLDIFIKTSLCLEDAYNLAFAKSKKTKDFKTFDQKLARKYRE